VRFCNAYALKAAASADNFLDDVYAQTLEGTSSAATNIKIKRRKS
jgi:hypothetical protein